jgi:hypothetical protein
VLGACRRNRVLEQLDCPLVVTVDLDSLDRYAVVVVVDLHLLCTCTGS